MKHNDTDILSDFSFDTESINQNILKMCYKWTVLEWKRPELYFGEKKTIQDYISIPSGIWKHNSSNSVMNHSVVGITLHQRMKSLRGTPHIFWFKTQYNHIFTMIPYIPKESDFQILRDGIMQSFQKSEKEGTKEVNLILLNFGNITEWKNISDKYFRKKYFEVIFETLEQYFLKSKTRTNKIYIS